MESPTNTEPADEANTPPSRTLHTDLIEDECCAFQVNTTGTRSIQHLRQREGLLLSLQSGVVKAMPTQALAWARAVEDKLLEEIEGSQDDVYTIQLDNHRLTEGASHSQRPDCCAWTSPQIYRWIRWNPSNPPQFSTRWSSDAGNEHSACWTGSCYGTRHNLHGDANVPNSATVMA